jgi:glycosyltransferase involved in cell wall biosynthesis
MSSINKKPLEVSIAIPAYNEGRNIRTLLEALLRQRQDNFFLREILVVSDGSNDETVANAKMVQSSLVKVFEHNQRMGKSARMDEIFRMFKGQVLLLLDADVLPVNNDMIEEMVLPFSNPGVGLVGGFPIPSSPRSFFERIMQVSAFLQARVKFALHGGNNVYSCHGRILALREGLAKKLSLESSAVGNDAFIYFSNKKEDYVFVFSPDAQVYFRMPGSYGDFLKQNLRFRSSREELSAVFGDWVLDEYRIPRLVLIKSLVGAFLKFPILSFIYVGIMVFAKLASLTHTPKRTGAWEISVSTKNL